MSHYRDPWPRDFPDEFGDLGLDSQSIKAAAERLHSKGWRGRAELMETVKFLMVEYRLDQFATMREAAE